MFFDGAKSVLDAAGASPAFHHGGNLGTAQRLEHCSSRLSPQLVENVDAVLAPNDNNAASIISILDKNGPTVPVSGQDASTAGLQNVLLGKQYGTVYKPFQLQVAAALEIIASDPFGRNRHS